MSHRHMLLSSVLRVVAVLLLVFAGLLGACDLAFRYLPFVHHRVEFDPDTGYRRIPGDRYRYGSDEFSSWMALNSLGIRGAEVNPEHHGLRIAFLGDSFTEAAQVDWKDSWPELVCRQLSETSECLNFGVQGYSTLQELATYLTRVKPLKPDIVVVAFYWNDWLENTLEPSNRLYRIEDNRLSLQRLPKPGGYEHIKWFLWNLLRPIAAGRSGTPARESIPDDIKPADHAVYAYMRWLAGVEAVKESEHPEFDDQRRRQEVIVSYLFREIAKDGAKPFALLLDGLKPWQRDQIVGLATTSKVSHLDLGPIALQDAANGKSWRYTYNLHYDIGGNRRVAELVADKLKPLITVMEK